MKKTTFFRPLFPLLSLLALCWGMNGPTLPILWAQSSPAEPLLEEYIIINFPENVEIKVLVEFVSKQMNVNIIYDDLLAGKKITLRAPSKIPKSSLMGLLSSILKLKGFVMIDADQSGWKRIIPATDLLQIARGQDFRQSNKNTEKPHNDSEVLTQLIELKHTDTKRAEIALKPFLTPQGASIIPIPERSMLLITDYSASMPKIIEVLSLIDQPRPDLKWEFYQAQNIDAVQAAQQITQILTARLKVLGGSGLEGIEITTDPRTNRVIMIGTPARLIECTNILKELDTPIGLETKVHQFKSISPERVDKLVKEMLGPVDSKRLYRAGIDKEANLLIATATPEIQKKIELLKEGLDKPIVEQQSPVRFYKLMNTTAQEVLQTITALQAGNGSLANLDFQDGPGSQIEPSLTGVTGLQGIEQATPLNPAPAPSRTTSSEITNKSQANKEGFDKITANTDKKLPQGVITADKNTNTIIVVAPPETQRIYEHVIKMLDKRRPQVLVEITLITLDTTNGFSFGIEISRLGVYGNGDPSVLTFSNFGLSTVDPTTGALNIKPGLGFNGSVISSDIANIIIRALATSSRAKVSSAPKILVNDNATGTLSSVNEQPYTSINTSNSVTSSTSFGGFVSAGTTISITPHISEDQHLQLNYTVTLNSFTGDSASAGIPPPRATSTVSSQVTIPDGQTVIIGGLNQMKDTETKQGVPILSDIPIIEYLFSYRVLSKSNSTLFVFVRPVILRDDSFADLKYISHDQLTTALIPDGFPSSEPILMK